MHPCSWRLPYSTAFVRHFGCPVRDRASATTGPSPIPLMTVSAFPAEQDQAPSCRTVLLPDAPEESDAFGPHQDVANAIATLISTEPGGRSIGLAGTWGAGKSTVIGLLRKALSRNPNYTVWVFDAWAHEGDPLRRTFLESLIDALATKRWLDEKRANKRKKRLSGRRRTGTQETSPHLSSFGRWSGLAAFLWPIAVVLLTSGLKDVGPFSRSAPMNAQLIAGFVVVAVALLALIPGAREEHRRVQGKRDADGNPLRPDYWRVIAKLPTLVTTRTTESGEPTSIEFERHFGQLMAEALADDTHRLILVVDNLDRVDPATALKIWSTLQTFLQYRSPRTTWLERLWVVMPFDVEAIRRLWAADDDALPSSASAADTASPQGQPTDNAPGNGTLATSFIDKSFQVVFEVPVPLVSDWRSYLLDLLRTALPDHKDEETLHRIYRLVAVDRHAQSAPTPRELKMIVNQLGALHRQRQDSIPLVDMAYYVLLRRRNCDVVKGLRSDDLPALDRRGLLSADARDNLAALAFGVPREKARQFLLRPEILAALEAGDGGALQAQQRHVGFDEVLEEAIEQASTDWRGAEGGKLMHAVVALSSAGLLDGDSSARARRAGNLQRLLTHAVRKTDTLMPIDAKTEDGIIEIARRDDDPELLRALARRYSQAVQSMPIVGDPAAAKAFVAQTVRVVSALVDAGLDVDDREIMGGETWSMGVPAPLANFFNVCNELVNHVPRVALPILRCFSPSATASAVNVTAQVDELIRNGRFTEGHRLALVSMLRVDGSPRWEAVFAVIRERLSNGSTLGSVETPSLIGSLVDARHVTAAAGALDSLVKQGYIGHHIQTVINQPEPEPLALLIYAHLLIDPGFQVRPNVGASASGYQGLAQRFASAPEPLASALAELVHAEGKESLLFDSLRADNKTHPLMASAIAHLLKYPDSRAVFTPPAIYDHWLVLTQFVDPVDLLEYTGCSEELIDRVKAEFDSTRGSLYSALLQRNDVRATLREWVADGLRSLSVDTWLAELRSGGTLLLLALEVQALGVDTGFGHVFREALQTFAGELARAERSPSDELAWDDVLRLLQADERGVLLDHAYSLVRDYARRIGSNFFRVFGDALTSNRNFATDDVSYPRVCEPMLEARNADGLAWIHSQLAGSAPAGRPLKPHHWKVLKKRIVQELGKNIDDDAKSVLEDLAVDVGVSGG